MKNLLEKIEQLEERNKKVEAEKAWEISLTRRILLIIFIYLAISFYFKAINISKPWLNAIVPAFAFMLSTLTLPFFKKLWLNTRYKKI